VGYDAGGGAPLFTPAAAEPVPAFFTPAAPAAPGYGAQPAYGQPSPADALVGQFAGMALGPPPTINLFTTPPDASLLYTPPIPLPLPPDVPAAGTSADPALQRCTLRAVPRTPALLAESKLPLAIVLGPHASSVHVPLVADGLIARCRRCRAYINPFVEFVDNGTRCAPAPAPPPRR
jgi:protein transport protein SEC24